MTRTQIGLLAAVVLGSAAFAIHARLSIPAVKPFHDPTICPVCGKKLPRPEAPCNWCEMKQIQEEIKAAQGGAAKGEFGTAGKLAIAAGGSVLLLLVGLWPRLRVFFRSRMKPETYFVIRCANCRRKLRYRADRAGREGICPGCRWVCPFPKLDEI